MNTHYRYGNINPVYQEQSQHDKFPMIKNVYSCGSLAVIILQLLKVFLWGCHFMFHQWLFRNNISTYMVRSLVEAKLQFPRSFSFNSIFFILNAILVLHELLISCLLISQSKKSYQCQPSLVECR